MRHSARAIRAEMVAAVLVVLAICALSGCGGGLPGVFTGGPSGDLRIQSQGVEPVALTGRFTTATYANSDAVEWSFLLSNVSADELAAGEVRNGKIVHIELLWIPRAGSTPIEATSTNASVRYVIIANGEVGVYGGAGFARPRGMPGDDRMTLAVRDASLRLLHSTDGFIDLLTPAQLSGTITADLDTRGTRIMHHAASQFVTDALGRSVIVFGEQGDTERGPIAQAIGPF